MVVNRGGEGRRPRPRPALPTKTAEEFERAPENQPRGVATAIIFDWSLVIFSGALLIIATVQRGPGSRQAAAAAALALLAGLPIALLGEALRRGQRGARPAQIIVSGLVGAVNVVGLMRDLSLLSRGVARPTTNLPALLAGTFVIWGLTRPQTIAWFARIPPARARARHGGRWLLFALGTSFVVGILTVIISLA